MSFPPEVIEKVRQFLAPAWTESVFTPEAAVKSLSAPEYRENASSSSHQFYALHNMDPRFLDTDQSARPMQPPPGKKPRIGAVLILLTERTSPDPDWDSSSGVAEDIGTGFDASNGVYLTLPLTERSQELKNHRGEVSFPGGGFNEHEDGDLVDTALREAEEEIGIPRADISVLGPLQSLYIPPSNFCIQPVVATLKPRSNNSTINYTPQAGEVERVFDFPCHRLFGKDAVKREERQYTGKLAGRTVSIPFYPYKQYKIWGATSIVLNRLSRVIATCCR